MSKTWIQSLSGKKLEPRALTAEMVGTIDEIAHSLAGENRFTKQTKIYYSVAEHSVRGSYLLPSAFALPFLLHELSEVYLHDEASPLKSHMWVEISGQEAFFPEAEQIPTPIGPIIRWTALEHQHAHVMLGALGLASIEPMLYSVEVKAMDLAMLAAEKRDLCLPEPEPWAGISTATPANTSVVEPWPAWRARDEFLKRYHELTSLGLGPQ